jgi:hypothetical protein
MSTVYQIFDAAVNRSRTSLANLPLEATAGLLGDMTHRALTAKKEVEAMKFQFFVKRLTILEQSPEWGAKMLATRQSLNRRIFVS